MNREEKIEKLRLVFKKLKTISSPINNLSSKVRFLLNLELLPIPTNSDNEITFDNIDNAMTLINEVKRLNNSSHNEIKNMILERCNELDIDINSDITIRFITS